MVAAVEGIAQLGAAGVSTMAELGRRAIAAVRAEADSNALEREEARLLAGQIVEAFDDQMLKMATAHHETFRPATSQTAEAGPVDEEAIRTRFIEQARQSTSALTPGKRRAAVAEATLLADTEIAASWENRSTWLRQEQTRVSGEWAALVANEPLAVLNALEDAFEDNQSPAVAIDCEGDHVTIIVTVAGSLPSTRPSVTRRGKLSNKAWSADDAATFHLTVMGSAILATIKETWAVAPSINAATVVAIAETEQFAIRGLMATNVMYRGTFTRARHERLAWSHVDPVDEISRADDVDLVRKGRAKAMQPLSLTRHPDLRDLLNQLEGAWDEEGGSVDSDDDAEAAPSQPTYGSPLAPSPANPPGHSGAALVPKGWYYDPWDVRLPPERQRRWWDGSHWTAHVTPSKHT